MISTKEESIQFIKSLTQLINNHIYSLSNKNITKKKI